MMEKIFNKHFWSIRNNSYVLLPTILITGFVMTIFLVLQFIVANAHASYQNEIRNQTINSIYYQIESLLVDDQEQTSMSINGYQITIDEQTIKIHDNKKTYQFDRFISNQDD